MTLSTPLSRRRFLQAGTVALVVGWQGTSEAVAVVTGRPSGSVPLTGWVSIDQAGRVTVSVHKQEMGQGVLTSIPQLVAEELEVDISSVTSVIAPVAPEIYGSHGTGGSASIRRDWQKVLQAGAVARDLLVRAAAQRWGVDAASCSAAAGQVRHDASGRKLGYGELVADAAGLTPAANVPLKPRSQYRVVGQPVKRLDTPPKVDGSARYGVDIRLPGMLYAVVERSPRFAGKLVDFDATAALAVPGVKRVLRVERDVFGHRREGVAVVATSSWAAQQGRRALKVTWNDEGFRHEQSDELERLLASSLDGPLQEGRSVGTASRVLSASSGVLEALYETPYQAHATLEPPVFTAHATADKLELWGPTQGPDSVRDTVARMTGRPVSQVHVHATLLGGAFGRKGLMDFPTEAAMLALQLDAPVQVLWTREDDLTQSPYRPAMTYRLRAALKDGRIDALEVLEAGQNFTHHFAGANPATPNRSVSEGLPEPFKHVIPHQRWADAPLQSVIPTMWWRAVYASTNAFAFDCFLDELARASGQDPLAFRLRHFDGDDAKRHARLVDTLARVSGWNERRRSQGRLGWGASVVECFQSIIGQVVVVAPDDDGLRVERVHVVVDCGLAVNPDTIRAQVEGSIVMAYGAALQHATRFADGRATLTNFHEYPLTRLPDAPRVEVHLIDSEAAPGGIGEPALPGFAPALANAVYDLTGQRVRRLPMTLAGLRPREAGHA